MVDIRCVTQDSVLLTAMVPFQGGLKIRKPVDIEQMAQSIKAHGFVTPFFLWRYNEQLFILDGHHRRATLVHMAMSDPSILQQEFPCVLIDADTEDEARKILLQCSSQYGKIDKKGAIEFTMPIVGYKAPCIASLHKPVTNKKATECTHTIIRLKVPKTKAQEFLTLMKQCDWVEIY